MVMFGRWYLVAFLSLMALFTSFLIWIMVALISNNVGSYTDVLISVACLCLSLLFLFALFLHYTLYGTTALVHVAGVDATVDQPSLITIRPPAQMRHVEVDVDGDTLHLHFAESQTSPHALAIAVYNTLDDGGPLTGVLVDT
jgi:hypothetical protein